MGASKKIRMALVDKGIKQTELAAMTGKNVQVLRNMLSKDNMTYATVETLANAIGCDVIFRDRKTGKLYR